MKQIEIEKGILMYYGNRAGYIENSKAFIDPMFQGNELKSFLKSQKKIKEVQWVPDLFDRLTRGKIRLSYEKALKNVRVWQLKPETDVRMKFIGYKELCQQFGPLEKSRYQCVYDGAVNTNDLEVLYGLFNMEHPEGYTGHSLSVSDILELYDEQGSQFYYVDSVGFQEIALDDKLSGITQTMQP